MKKWGFIVSIIAVIIVVGYTAHRIGYEAGRDYTAQTDSTDPKRWVNKKWGYEITFPGQWDAIKRGDQSIKSPGADVFCSNKSGASTAVFLYPRGPGDSLDSISDDILSGYKEQGDIKIIEKKDYIENGLSYRRLILRSAIVEYTEYYTIILSAKIILCVSSNCRTSIFESSKKDFEGIVASVKFFN